MLLRGVSASTSAPTPWTILTKPLDSRIRRPSRIVLRATPSCSASSRSGGSFDPTRYWPSRMSCSSWAAMASATLSFCMG